MKVCISEKDKAAYSKINRLLKYLIHPPLGKELKMSTLIHKHCVKDILKEESE